MNIITNNVPRFTVEGWDAIRDDDVREAIKRDCGECRSNALYVSYRGTWYDVDDFTVFAPGSVFAREDWHGYVQDTFFSGTLIKDAGDNDFGSVIMGRYYT